MTSPAPGARNMIVVLLVRLAAVHVVSIYACVFTVIHWLRDVPIHDSWAIGVIGFLLLFLAIGVMITGRALGFFSTAQHRFSVDWLPLLLIWPLGLSIWACIALGLSSAQTRQEMANGIALPLMILAATVPPLLLGRIPSWPQPRKSWHKLLDGHYALASLAAAVTVFLAVQSALTLQPVSGNPAPTMVVSKPAASANSQAAAQPGFVCDPAKAGQPDPEDEEGENQCPPPRTNAPSAAGVAPQTIPVPPAATASVQRPIDQHASSWGAIWMLISGALLGGGRLLAAKRAGGAGSADLSAALSTLQVPEQGKQLAGQLLSAAQTEVKAQAGSWLRNSGLPNADLLATIMGKFLGTGSSPPPAGDAAATPPSLLAVASAAPPAPDPTTAGPVSVAAGPASAPPSLSQPVAPPPAPLAAPPPPPPPPAPPPADDGVSKALQERVKGMDSALAKQQDTAAKLQSSVGALQDKLDKQSEAMAQVMAESQRAAEESRRTIDSLTRLVQSMKADLDRLSRNQIEGR
ncbi:hypothetical protein CHU95_05305 [Niveispirillum lacus]|uniref:Uncharacterized protein n=1 Tax=Niveispirillum lacus TaxID=1981099 RepID=A0A255Z405_9PROT|nr:hypothetical protein [Niveispirillum lacus]OYQ36208.1 hypothetical protein CHU95_05305 [Niveispirillum lacus]